MELSSGSQFGYGDKVTKTYEQRALEARIKDRILYCVDAWHMPRIEHVNIPGLAEDIIEWANTREKRHGRKVKN